MKKIVLVVSMIALSACAKNPDKIAAANIGSNEYKAYSCKQLGEAKVKHSQSLENLVAAQKDAQGGDFLGVLVFGLPLSSMTGNDKETAIAVTKGHLQSIETEQQRKSCK